MTVIMKLTKPTDPEWNMLSEISTAVDPLAIETHILPRVNEMAAIIRSWNTPGVGLAAPQVGIPLRFFIYGVGEKNCTVCINPVILEANNYREGEEGCLSFPGKKVIVQRAQNLIVEYTNIKGERIERKMKGLNAVIFQHELDHLNGMTIFDRDYSKSAKKNLEELIDSVKAKTEEDGDKCSSCGNFTDSIMQSSIGLVCESCLPANE